MTTLITVRPLTQWARNRVRQHGDTFEVLGTGKLGTLVQSLGLTYKGASGPEKWMGWFDIGKDATITRALAELGEEQE